MKPTELVGLVSQLNDTWIDVMTRTPDKFAICLRNDDCVDLDIRKVYPVLPDPAAAKDGYLRVIDESGEDYLYPADYFVSVEVPVAARKLRSTRLLA